MKKNQINLDVLNDIDAVELFKANYETNEDIGTIVKEYLGNHPLFIKLTASSLKNGFITIEELNKRELKNIDIDDKKTFQEHLEDNFNRQYESLKKEDLKELLLILSLFPSLEIDISVFEKCFDDDNIKNKLIKLEKNGWLDKKENSFKLHQIIKEYLKSQEELDYEKVKLIFKRVAEFINPDDSSVNANSLIHYIPIIESFLNDYEKCEDEYIIGLNDSLTFLYYSLAKYERALDIQDRMLELREKLFGKDNNEYAKSLNLKALVFRQLKNYSESLKLNSQAIRIRGNKEVIKKYLAVSYNNISMIYSDLGENELALEFLKKSLDITEKTPDDISLAISYGNMSLIYSNLKKNDLALDYAKKSLNIFENILDNNHINLAISYGILSYMYQKLNKYNLALIYSNKTLKIFEFLLDINHPDLAKQYNNIAHIYKDLKECKKAKAYMQKAKNIFSLYEYKNKEVIIINQFIKEIEHNIKKEEKLNYQKRGRHCKDLEKEN